MDTETIVMCVVALILGMIMFHLLKGVCGCKTVEGQGRWVNGKTISKYAGYYMGKQKGNLSTHQRVFNANHLARQLDAAGNYVVPQVLADERDASKILFVERFGNGNPFTTAKAEDAFHCITQTGGDLSSTLDSIRPCISDVKGIINSLEAEEEEGAIAAVCSMIPFAGWAADAVDGVVALGTSVYGAYNLEQAAEKCSSMLGNTANTGEHILHIGECMAGRMPNVCTSHSDQPCNHIAPIPFHPHLPKNYNDLKGMWRQHSGNDGLWDGNLFNSKGHLLRLSHESDYEYFNRIINNKILGLRDYNIGELVDLQEYYGSRDNLGADLTLNEVEQQTLVDRVLPFHQQETFSEMIEGEHDDGLIYFDPYGQYKITARHLINQLPSDWIEDRHNTGLIDGFNNPQPGAAAAQIVYGLNNPGEWNLPGNYLYDSSGQIIFDKNQAMSPPPALCDLLVQAGWGVMCTRETPAHAIKYILEKIRDPGTPGNKFFFPIYYECGISVADGNVCQDSFGSSYVVQQVMSFRELIRGPPGSNHPNAQWGMIPNPQWRG